MNSLLKIRKMLFLITIIGLLGMSCAPSARSVRAINVSPILYERMECDMLLYELASVESKFANLTMEQDRAFKSDQVVVGCTIGLGFVFLGVLGLAGFAGLSSAKRTDVSSELAQIKGQQEAINKALYMKGGCK